MFGVDAESVVFLPARQRSLAQKFEGPEAFARAAAWVASSLPWRDVFGPYRFLGNDPYGLRATLAAGAAAAGTPLHAGFVAAPPSPFEDIDPFAIVARSRLTLEQVLAAANVTGRLLPADFAESRTATVEARVALELAVRFGYTDYATGD